MENVIHNAIESLELEGTFNGHLVQLLCNEQGHPSGAQSLVQPGLESLKGQCIHHISEQLVPVPHHPLL